MAEPKKFDRIVPCLISLAMADATDRRPSRRGASALHAVATPCIRQFSTDAAEPGRAFDLWAATLDRALVQSSRDSKERATFAGRADSLLVGDLSFTRARATCQDVYRTTAHIGKATEAPSFLVSDVASTWHMRQGGDYVQLRPGDLLLVDSAEPYELHFRQHVDTLIVELPKSWLGQWLAQPESVLPRKIPRDVGWGKSLSALFLQLNEQLDLAVSFPPDVLRDHIGAMLAACTEFSPLGGSSPGEQGIARQAERSMRARLGQSGLTAGTVAAELGISVRTLHRAFASQGDSFLTTLRGMRARLAAEMLAQHRLDHLSIAAVGLRCGFADPSHFIREFRRAWGTTPAQWRAAHSEG